MTYHIVILRHSCEPSGRRCQYINNKKNKKLRTIYINQYDRHFWMTTTTTTANARNWKKVIAYRPGFFNFWYSAWFGLVRLTTRPSARILLHTHHTYKACRSKQINDDGSNDDDKSFFFDKKKKFLYFFIITFMILYRFL